MVMSGFQDVAKLWCSRGLLGGYGSLQGCCYAIWVVARCCCCFFFKAKLHLHLYSNVSLM